MREKGRGKPREEMSKQARMHAHALACAHGRHACTQTERVLGCENRRAKSNQWRAEAGIGGVTHVVNERPIRALSPVDFELVSRSVHRVCVHARERRTGERDRVGKKAGECTREQRESYEFAKEGERNASDGRRKKEEERRVCIASRLPSPPTLGGKGVKEKDRKRGTTCRTREPLERRVVI